MDTRPLAITAKVLLLLLFAAACSRTAGMRAVPQSTVAPPGPDEAVIVFMRPSPVGDLYSTSVFELRPEGDRFVAILRGQMRVAYRTKPGPTRFMLVTTGGFDDYMDAELAGGKTYAAVVRYGTAGAQSGYLLRPVRIADYDRGEVETCMSECAWAENTERSETWGRNHLRELPARKAKTLPGWEAQPVRPALKAADGR